MLFILLIKCFNKDKMINYERIKPSDVKRANKISF